jgi:protein-S-isoprenylcysteine O-methyltransferase Ste14
MAYHWSDILFAVGFVAYVGIRDHFIRRTLGAKTVENRIDLAERAIFGLVFVGSLLLPAAYLLTPLLRFASYDLPWGCQAAGAALIPLSLVLFWRSHADLGVQWSPSLEIREGHRLIKHGVYRRIRHPMYAAILLFGLGQGLLLRNWLVGWSALFSFAILYIARLPREERMMRETFGEEYADYARRTGRIFPKLT